METFTFFADLVGTSAAYEASPEGAYRKLHEYYNEVFHGLATYYEGYPDRRVEMFSDSLVVTGDDPLVFLSATAPVYMKLLSKGLILRGGMVSGKLRFDVRMERKNFEKKLPDSDILARCVSLERKTKGARLVIDGAMARTFLANHPDWLTLDGYSSNPMRGDRSLVAQRSICPLPDGSAFELLYPILANSTKETIQEIMNEMDYMISTHSKDIAIHYSETKRLFEISEIRLHDNNFDY